MSEAKQAVGIYTRMMTAIAGRQGTAPACALFIGKDEERELKALLSTYDADVGIVDSKYDPVKDEATRTEFRGVKIYRVDAQSFLAAL